MTLRAGLRLLIALAFLTCVGVACATPVIPTAASAAGVPQPDPTATPLPSPTPAPSPTAAPINSNLAVLPTPTPTTVPVPGLTDTTIRVGMIADLETNGVADNLSLGAWEAMNAWADSVNANGGIAGRQVELVLADSKLYLHREAVTFICSNDVFALVGSKAIEDGNGVAEMVSNACGIPDFPAVALMSERKDSRVTWVSNPFPSPFYQAGPLRWMADQFPEAAASSSRVILGAPSLRVESELMREAAAASGFEFVYEPLVTLDEDDFGAEVDEMEAAGVQSLVWTGHPEGLIELLSAKAFSSAPPLDFVLCGPDCYSQDFIEDNAGLAEGVSAWIPHLPFSELAEAPELVNYVFSLGGVSPEADPSSQGVAAWTAGRLFEEAASRAVGAGTPAYDRRALTRESLIAAAETIDEWTANGVYAVGGEAPNPAAGNGVPSPCFVLMQVVDGAWERQHPTATGRMDCTLSNRASLLSSAGVGLVETPVNNAEQGQQGATSAENPAGNADDNENNALQPDG